MYQRELEIAIEAAREAGQGALRHWRTGLQPESKEDDSPVTRADREAEKRIAEILRHAFPNDGVLGEEGASRPGSTGRRWIIDPIDGTRDFVRGNPCWAVLIGFEDQGRVQAGVAFLPALGDLYTACRGQGAYCNGERIQVSAVSLASQAVLCVNGLNSLTRFPFAPGFLERLAPFWSVRSYGGCLDAMMVARGQADLWIEPAGKEWDFAPLQVIIEEAGGLFFNFDGGNRIDGGNCVACTPGLVRVAHGLLRRDGAPVLA